MHNSKDTTELDENNVDDHRDAGSPDHGRKSAAKESGESDGWQQYRKWISKAPAPRSRRSNVDPSLYTWKGYRSWSEQIRRNWSDS